MKKRVLSIILALCLCLSIIPIGMIQASAEVNEGGSGEGQQMPAPQNVSATFVGFVAGDTGKAVVIDIQWDALPKDIDGGNKFVEMYPSLKEDANLSLPMSFEAWLGQATLIPVDELTQGGIGYVTEDGRSTIRSVVHILQPGDLKVDENGMACGVKENDKIDIDIYTAGWDPETQTDSESEHKHVEIVYTEENVKIKKTFTEEGGSECTHENQETKAEVQNVKGNVTVDGKSTGVALLKETEECVDCHQKKTTKVYRLRFKSRRQMAKYLSGRYAKLKNGKTVHFKGKYEKIEKVFWNKKHIKVSKTYNKKKGSVILDFTDEFLATVEDGIHELMVCNGDEFTAMSVTVQDHKMVEIGAFDVEDHAEISADQYEALMQQCEEDGIEVVDCDLDAFYAGGFMVNADDVEVEMSLSKDMLVETGDALELPAVTVTSETGVEYAEDEDYTLSYYQVTEEDGEPVDVEIAKEDIKEIGTYKVVATPTRNGVLSGEAWEEFSVIDPADCPHNWEFKCDERGHWQYCDICGMTKRIQAHEDFTVRSEIVRVDIPIDSDFEENNLLCVTVCEECGVCGYRTPAALYNVAHTYPAECYPLATLRHAVINKSGNTIRMDGDFSKDELVFWDGVLLLNMETGGRSYEYTKEEGNVLFFSSQFLETVEDGEHELLVLNGDEFTVMTVTVRDHFLSELSDKDLNGYEEIDFFDYYDLYKEYYAAYADIVYCDLDELLPLIGDVDGDGEVTIIDATFAQRYATELTVPFTNDQMMLGDVDGDGEVTIVDATYIQRYATQIDTPYAIGLPKAVFDGAILVVA